MKHSRQILLGAFLLTVLQIGLTSCVSDGYVGVSNGVYYGPRRDPWFNDDPWVDGHRWYGGYGGPQVDTSIGIYIHPPRHRR